MACLSVAVVDVYKRQALDIRIYMKEEITAIRELLAKLEKVILDLARQHVDTIMPVSYTHLDVYKRQV